MLVGMQAKGQRKVGAVSDNLPTMVEVGERCNCLQISTLYEGHEVGRLAPSKEDSSPLAELPCL
jgi:hypothetical protein